MNAAIPDLQSVRGRSGPARPLGYAILVVLLATALASGFALLVALGSPPPLGLVLIFGGLMVLTENRDRLFGDETSISGSIVVAIASIVAFHRSAPMLGPLLCSSCAGLYWPHVRERSFAKMIINASTIGFSALFGAAVFGSLSASRPISLHVLLLISVPVVATYWIVNTVVLAGATSLLRGPLFGRSAVQLLQSETPMLGFAVLGACCGFVFDEYGSGLGLGVLVTAVAFIDTVVIAPRVWTKRAGAAPILRTLCGFPPVVVCFGFFVAEAGALLGGTVVLVTAAIASAVVALMRVHQRTGCWDRQLAFGVAIIDAPRWALLGLIGVIAQAAGLWVAAVCLGLVFAAMLLASSWIRRREARLAEEDRQVGRALECAVLEGRSVPASTR